MTNKERVVCAIEGKPVDHVPVSFSLHFPREVAFGDKAVDAHIEFYEKTGVDIMKIMNEHLLPQFGAYEGIHSWKEFPHHHVSDKFIQDQLDLIKKIQDKTPDGTFYLGTLHGVLASMIHPFEPQIGYEKVRDEHTRCFREDKDAYLTAAKITTETMIMLIEEMGKIGVDGVYYASLGAEKRYFTDAEFAEAIAPFDMEMLKAIKDNNMYSFLHTCKDGLNMKRYADYAKYSDVINWGIYEGNDFSLEDGKKLFPGKTLMGGIANRKGILVEGPVEELQETVKSIIRSYGKDKLIFGADCTVPTELSYERMRKACEAAAEV